MCSGKKPTSLMVMRKNGTRVWGGGRAATPQKEAFQEGFPGEVACCADTWE